MRYLVGDRVRFRQVPHEVPLESSALTLPIHESPRSGFGVVQFVGRVGSEIRLFVLPDEDRGKRDSITLLLRVPPDEVSRVELGS